MDPVEHLRNSLADEGGVSEDDLSRLFSAFQLRRLDRGDRLLAPGEVCSVEGLVTRGCLRTYFIEPDGSERVLYFAPEGWCVTDIDSFRSERPTILGIDALEASDVWIIDKPGRAVLQSEFPGSDRILRLLSENALVACQRRLVGGMRKTATQRYLEFRRLYPGLELRIPQYHIAAYLGISPEFLSKLRKKLIRLH